MQVIVKKVKYYAEYAIKKDIKLENVRKMMINHSKILK